MTAVPCFFPRRGRNVTPEMIATARGLFSEATRIDSTYAVPWNNLADLDRAAGRLADAAAGFRHAARLDPGNATAQANLGIVLEGLGWPREAEEAYRSRGATGHRSRRHRRTEQPRRISCSARGARRTRSAFSARRSAPTRSNEGNAPLWKNHGIASLALGDTAQARTSFEQALALRSGYVEPLVGLAFTAAARGDEAETIARWREAEARDRNRSEEARRTLSTILKRDFPVSE